MVVSAASVSYLMSRAQNIVPVFHSLFLLARTLVVGSLFHISHVGMNTQRLVFRTFISFTSLHWEFTTTERNLAGQDGREARVETMDTEKVWGVGHKQNTLREIIKLYYYKRIIKIL